MNRRGFSMIELLVGMSVGMIVLLAIYASTEMGQRSSVAVERKVLAQQDARAALDLMALEIRMASYNPNYATTLWIDGPTGACGNIAGNQAYKGIQEATASSITIEMDMDGSSAVGDGPNEVIRYNYDAGNQYITRSTNCGGAQPFLGAQSASQRDVRVANNAAGIPVFRYFDGAGNEILPGSLPGAIPTITRITITLVVDTEAVDQSLQRRRRTIYSTSTISRNHAIVF